MNGTREYSIADVEALANAVLESWEDMSDSSYVCNYCSAEYRNKKPDGSIKHSQNCATLIAQDVLTV